MSDEDKYNEGYDEGYKKGRDDNKGLILDLERIYDICEGRDIYLITSEEKLEAILKTVEKQINGLVLF